MPTHERLNAPLLLSIKEAAFTLGVSERTIWTMVQERQLPYVRIGRRLLFSRTSLESWIAFQQIDHEGQP